MTPGKYTETKLLAASRITAQWPSLAKWLAAIWIVSGALYFMLPPPLTSLPMGIAAIVVAPFVIIVLAVATLNFIGFVRWLFGI
ncbi:MAG TPA: hypothetical protein DCY36_06835 [Acidimicrobiaceae bacterium]|jgi:hypothetical protein|nr:hypothetical protein [Acidimicrobiaceae bacterium]|tara:strand:- start:865 stop:1116 length:252 start_codon:yes stop_codon:yes gene_type:complete